MLRENHSINKPSTHQSQKSLMNRTYDTNRIIGIAIILVAGLSASNADEPQGNQERLASFLALVDGQHDIKNPRFELADHTTFVFNGWTMHLNDRLWLDDEGKQSTQKMLRLLSDQMARVVKTVPEPAVERLRKVPVWINPEYENERPRCEYHPGAGWLRDNGRDPAMAKAIEISNVRIFEFENRRMPYLMLHELSHAYHDQVLGFNEPRILAVFEVARDSGSYESVRRFTGVKTVNDKAYAISDHKEYFAESTEAYFGKNDFFPFDRSELKAHDPQMHALLGKLW